MLYCCSAVQFSSSLLYVVYQLKGMLHARRLQAYTNICEIECRTNHKLLSVCPSVSIAGSASGHVDVAAFLYQFQEPRFLSPTSQTPAVIMLSGSSINRKQRKDFPEVFNLQWYQIMLYTEMYDQWIQTTTWRIFSASREREWCFKTTAWQYSSCQFV